MSSGCEDQAEVHDVNNLPCSGMWEPLHLSPQSLPTWQIRGWFGIQKKAVEY